jgi:hypothetical protein
MNMPDVYGAQGNHGYGDDHGAGSKPQPLTTGVTGGGRDGSGIGPKGPISAGNNGSTNPPLRGDS